jgi:hypothetical protein
MTIGRIQDPERANTIIMSFKTAAGAVLAIQNIKLIYCADVTTERLRVDADATSGGKQDCNAHGRRMVLIYKTNMHPGSIPNPEQCTTKVDRNARKRRLITTLHHLDLQQDTTSPPPELEQVEEMQEQQQLSPQQQGELSPSGSGTATPAQTPTQHELNGGRAPTTQGRHVPTKLSFADPDPLRTTWETIGTRAKRASSAPIAPATGTGIPLTKKYDPIAEHGSGTNDRDNERLRFGSLSGASGTHSSARNTRGRDPIPLTPEILHLLDRLEPDKGKQAMLLTEHLTGRRTLPSTEAELHTNLERRAARELKSQQVAVRTKQLHTKTKPTTRQRWRHTWANKRWQQP